MVDQLGERIYHVHLHDVRPTDWRDHRAPGRGLIDWPRLFAALVDLRYPDLLSFELEEPDPIQALQESKAFVESLIVNPKA
jgi:sugar phosphate isomerase/epimerase